MKRNLSLIGLAGGVLSIFLVTPGTSFAVEQQGSAKASLASAKAGEASGQAPGSPGTPSPGFPGPGTGKAGAEGSEQAPPSSPQAKWVPAAEKAPKGFVLVGKDRATAKPGFVFEKVSKGKAVVRNVTARMVSGEFRCICGGDGSCQVVVSGNQINCQASDSCSGSGCRMEVTFPEPKPEARVRETLI